MLAYSIIKIYSKQINMLINKNIINLFVFISLASFSLVATSQSSTHQTITKKSFAFVIDLEKSDHVVVKVSNLTGHVMIRYVMTGIPFKTGVADYCYAWEKVQLTWISQWKASGVIQIGFTAYEYSYQITVNGVIFKKQENAVRDFVDQVFPYSKIVHPHNLTMTVLFNSLQLDKLYLRIIKKGVKGESTNIVPLQNKIFNNFTINIMQTLKSFQFKFFLDQKLEKPLEKHTFDIVMQVPNQMLKGCHGTNFYDPRIRACPSKTTEPLDYLQLHHIGRYPSFQILEPKKISIKITIIEIQKFHLNRISNDSILTLFVANTSDKEVFRNLTQNQLKGKYPLRQECVLKYTVCHFIITFEPGNYTIMPVIFGGMDFAYVYLFQRGEGQNIVERYYSTLPLIAFNNYYFYQSGVMLQFASHKQKLTEITLYSKQLISKTTFQVFGYSKVQYQSGQETYEFIKVISDVDEIVPNPDSYKIHFFFELQPDSLYLFLVRFSSIDKTLQLQEKKRHWNQQIDGPFPIISTDSLFLETDNLHFSIKNGKFPHKKFNMTPIDDDSSNKQNQTIQDDSILNGTLLFTVLGAVATGVIILVLLVILAKKLRNKVPPNYFTDKQIILSNPQSTTTIELTKKKGPRMQISSVVDISINNDFTQPLL